jgi:hypothetical protein
LAEDLVVSGLAIAIAGWFVATTAWILVDESLENEERAASESREVGENQVMLRRRVERGERRRFMAWVSGMALAAAALAFAAGLPA